MKNALLVILTCLFYLFLPCMSAQDQITPPTLEVVTPGPEIVTPKPDVPTIQLEDLEARATGGKTYLHSPGQNGKATLTINGDDQEFIFENGSSPLDVELSDRGQLQFISYKNQANQKNIKLYHIAQTDNGLRVRNIPLWLSLLPPLIAIMLALIFKEVVVSLFAGIWVGAFIAGGLRIESFYYIVQSFLVVIQKYIIHALADADHISIIVFSLLIGGMVAIISKNGGMAGIVLAFSKYAKSPRSSQFITWILGVAIFFDDYANTLIVGNTMRSVTDKFKISREKLAYIVDSTAAPVASIAFITTWIGYELGFIDTGIKTLDILGDTTPYAVFLSSLKYSFYPVLTLIFMLILIYTQKDFGAMHKAEVRARTTGRVSPALTQSDDEPDMEDLSPVDKAPHRWYNAAIPVLVVILMTLYGLIDTGIESCYSAIMETKDIANSYGSVWANLSVLGGDDNISFFTKLGILIGNSNSYTALLWASLSGVVAAIFLTISQRIINLFDTMHWMATGFKTMLPAVIILTLAWSLAKTTGELHTADYLSSVLEGSLNPYLFPVVIFILSAFIAFSTGSSWSTMAILYPIAIPTTYAICSANGFADELTLELLYNVIATVLAASVLGDHCSPISDTTILSSLATDCNHIDHVKTQLPYALVVGTVSLFCVGLSTFLGGGWLISVILLIVAVLVLFGIVKILGKEAV